MSLPVLTIAGAVKLPEKGQTTTCYDEEGNVIPCTDTGKDSDIQAGVAWDIDLYGINSGSDVLTGLHKNSGLACVWPVSASNSTINPDIKANNSDVPITIFQTDSLAITVSLDYESSQEIVCDWWIAALTPFGWYNYDVASASWSYAGDSYTALSAAYQGALFDLDPYSVANWSSLSGGNYTFYFAIDTNQNGSLDFDQLYYDSVDVNIIQANSMIITPNDFKLALDGEIELKVQVLDVSGNLLLYTDAFPVVVSWKSSGESVASVDEEGVVRGVGLGSATITATTGDITKDAKVVVESSSMASISLSPSRLSLDTGEEREFDVEALSSYGSPTTLDCTGGEIVYDSAYIYAEFNDVQGEEKVDVEGIQSGSSLLTLNCGGFSSSPVVIQVKPPVTFPKPSDDYDFGIQPDLAVNGSQIYISSYDQVSGKLILTYFQTVWSSETLEGNDSYGKFSQTIIDPLNDYNPVVCALEDTYLTCWNFSNRGFWDKHQVDEIASSFDSFDGRISAVANEDGVIRILYTTEEGSLKMAESSLSSRDDWSISSVVGSNVSYIDSNVAPDGLPRIAFQFGNDMYYGALDSYGQWSFQLIDESASEQTGIRLTLGDDNRPQVVYYKNGNLVNAEKSDNTWWNSVITTVNTGENYSFGFGLNRHSLPRVSYYDADTDTLKYAYKLASDRLSSSNRWRLDNPSSDTSIGIYSELIVDEYQRAQIVYYNLEDKQVEYYVEPYLLDYTETNVLDDADVSNLDISSGTCTFSIDPTNKTFDSSSGTGSVSVTASTSDCIWTATSNNDWITIGSGGLGNGDGTVNYSVSTIDSAEDRTGTITVADKTFTITQTDCTYSLSSTNKTFDSSGGTGSVSVTASTSDCIWTATSNDDWITIDSGSSVTGDGTVNYSISAIDSTEDRTGTMTIAGETFTITQTGCTYSLSSTNKTFDSSSGTGSVSVTASTSDCIWTATSNNDWITIGSGGLGNGDGTVNYSVSTIDSAEDRTGTMTIAGETFTITQTGCTYSLSPTNKTFDASSGTGSVSVTASVSICSWTATSNDDWITIDSGSSGTGNGTVNYSISANDSTGNRTGTMTIAGETSTITQTGCTYSLSPTTKSFSSSSGTGSVSVTASTNICSWIATSNNEWITIDSGSSGTGNGTVNYYVSTNTSTSRTGSITIAGKTFTVTQTGI